MSIKMNELVQETRVKFQEAIADGRITAEEWKNFSKEEQELLSKGLGGKTPIVGDDIVIKTIKKAPEAKNQERAELSWGEIGKQGLKSVGNFFKGMVCDEDGFSLKRTATTIGVGLAFAALAAISAPVALAAGAVMGGCMAIHGGKNLIEGTKEYYNATTHEEAVAAMEKAMDGGVETAGGIAALFGVRKGYSAMKSAKAKPVQPAETKPVSEPIAEAPTPRKTRYQRIQEEAAQRKANANTTQMRQTKEGALIEETFNAEGRVTRSYKLNEDGSSYEVFRNKSGTVETKKIYTKTDGTKTTIEYVGDKTITTTVKNGKTSIVETTHLENGLTKSVHKSAEGKLNKVEYHDRYGNLVKTTLEDSRFIGYEAVIA